MAGRMPSLVALLGLLAVAGYQNRDKLGNVLGGLQGQGQPGTAGGQPNAGGLEGMLGGLGGLLGGAGAAGGLGSILSGGLGDLVERFNGAGRGQTADSWIKDGLENEDIDPASLEATLGEDTLTSLTEQTGLSRQELLERLTKTLPTAVNKLTPAGRLPTEAEAESLKF